MSTAISPVTAPATRRGGFWRAPGFLASTLVTLTVLLANAAYLLLIRTNDPKLYHSGLGDPEYGRIGVPAGKAHGAYTVDPNDGWTSQALGRAAAKLWSEGHLPLWNVYEGLGQPLAGEMQSAALFQPFIMLHLLPNGVFFMHVVLEIVAGLTMLAFLRTYGLSWVASTAAGALFAVNGVFSVMTNAPFNPIAFLPMCLWGVELVAQAVRARRRPRLGLAVIAAGLAWSLYAGFPETALLQGLFIVGWVLVRTHALAGQRLRFVAWNGAGAVAGVLLAAPALLALAHFLGFGFTAYHGDGHEAPWAYPATRFFGFFLPYASGSMGVNPLGQTGYVPLGVALLALVGLSARRAAAVKLFLAAVIVVLLLNMYGVEVVHTILNLVPGMTLVLIYKYGIILIVFAATILAAFAIDELRNAATRRRAVLIASVLALAYTVAALAHIARRGAFVAGWSPLVITISILAAAALVALLLRRGRRAAALAGCVVVVQGALLYSSPQLNASPPRDIDTAPISYLQRHLGASRFYTIGPIQPNYGSYWGLAQLNANDLPVPQKYADYVTTKLRPGRTSPAAQVPPGSFSPYLLAGLNFTVPQQKQLLAAYGQQQRYFRDAAVRYLVTAPGVVDDASAGAFSLRKVFSSPKTEIFEDTRAAGYYTSIDDACTVTPLTRGAARFDCERPGTLIRRELNAPGWTAHVNGRAQGISADDKLLYQRVPLPEGASTVTFTYYPPHFKPAMALSGLTLAALALHLVVPTSRRTWPRRRRRGRGAEAGGGATRVADDSATASDGSTAVHGV